MSNFIIGYKSWWSGDSRVEPFMQEVREAIERSHPNATQEQRTDIYNRCYEAVYDAIIKYSSVSNVLNKTEVSE